MLTPDVKVCCTCKVPKLFTDFSKNKRTKDGHKYSCKACISLTYFKNQEQEKAARKKHYQNNKQAALERSYEWRGKNPDKRQLSERKRNLRQKYGLSWEQFVTMYEEQHKKCHICHSNLSIFPSEPYPSACVDHCHTTNKVRGLLCYNCNLILGHALDNVQILQSSIEYLNAVNK